MGALVGVALGFTLGDELGKLLEADEGATLGDHKWAIRLEDCSRD